MIGDRWWPQAAKQEGDKTSKKNLCNIWKQRNERRNVGGASIESMNSAPPRKGCVVNGLTTKACNKCANSHPPPAPRFARRHDSRLVAQDLADLRQAFVGETKSGIKQLRALRQGADEMKVKKGESWGGGAYILVYQV